VAGGKTAEPGERASLGGPAEQDVSSPTSRLIDPQNREGGCAAACGAVTF
jgi:hypothetical protein